MLTEDEKSLGSEKQLEGSFTLRVLAAKENKNESGSF